jgi:large repetitive protein
MLRRFIDFPPVRFPAPIRPTNSAALAAGLVCLLALVGGCGPKAPGAPEGTLVELQPGLGYTNQRIASVPWSIHVLRASRSDVSLGLQSVHAGNGALGLAPLGQQVRGIPAARGRAVAGVNGDFYQRDRAFAGDPRGLQVCAGELVSAPNGACLWVDAAGQPHAGEVAAKFQVTWPDHSATPFGLNEERKPDGLVLYTAAVGASTQSGGGRELLLEPAGAPAFGPLAVNARFRARVREVRTAGNTPMTPGLLVLSAGPSLARRLPAIAVGDIVELDTDTSPALAGATAAIGGGPVLVRDGKPVRVQVPDDDSYQFKSMLERHPRSAVGWNRDHVFLITVDGRQKASAGMTLEELAGYLVRLGCTDAMNLDGGGSATLWADGRVLNQPSDGQERPIANALVLVRRERPTN